MNIYNLEYNDNQQKQEDKPQDLGHQDKNSSISIVLSSPEMHGQACFFFWHSMYGGHVETLSAYVAYGQEQFGQLGELYFQKSGTQGPRWTETKMNVGNDHGDEPYKVRIEGLVDKDYVGEMSLDDIRFELGNCFEDADHPWELCSFESVYEIEICGYSSPEDNQVNWKLVAGDQEGLTDHTLATGKGHYIGMDLTSDDKGKRGQFVSPFFQPFDEQADSYCLQFFWLAEITSSNTGGGRLNVRQYTGSPEDHTDTIITTVPIYNTADKNPTWMIGEAEIKKGDDNFAVAFEMIAGNSDMTFGLDDIKINPGHCSIYNCDFEIDWCFWYNLKDDDADMSRYVTDKGSYLYLDESAVTDTTKKFTYARIKSQQFPGTPEGSDKCMTFLYFMDNWDNSTERLSVALSGNGHERTIWEVKGIPNGNWTKAYVPISFSTGAYNVILETGIRAGAPGSVAVDTISFLPDSCEMQPPNALPYEYSEEKIDCSFDSDLCEWSSNSETGANFEIVGKRPTQANSGPDAGQNNNFLYLDSIKFSNHSMSLFSTPAAPPPHGFCVSFYYDMFGTDFSEILLYLQQMQTKTHEHIEDTTLMWAKHGSQLDRWIRKEINIPNTLQGNWRLEFAMSTKSNFGDIALDTLDLKRGPCYHSHNCDFELGDMCRWENITGPDPGNVTQANQHWSVVRGIDMMDLQYFPFLDHSSMSFDSYYLTVDMGQNAQLYDKARFSSKYFGENFGTQCLSFYWSYMGKAEIEFNVHTYKGDPLEEGGTLFGVVYKRESPDWRFTQFEITEEGGFEVRQVVKWFMIENI